VINLGKLEDEIVAYATATLMYTNGVCPFCGEEIAKEGSIRLIDVREHIEREYPLWVRSYRRLMSRK